MTIEVAPWIPQAPVLAVIGQSVGPREAQVGRPFIGPAGRVLRGWLETVGLDPDQDVMYTNVEMCYHPDDPNYLPSASEVKAALPRLEAEVAACPTINGVVLVGAAASHLKFAGRMGEMHGQRREWTTYDGGAVTVLVPVWACYHPSYYLRSRSQRERARVENECLGVLAQAAAVAQGRDVEGDTLPTPTYEEEVVIRG